MYDLITFKLMDILHNVDISFGTCMWQKWWGCDGSRWNESLNFEVASSGLGWNYHRI